MVRRKSKPPIRFGAQVALGSASSGWIQIFWVKRKLKQPVQVWVHF